jgi:hypothetical protein
MNHISSSDAEQIALSVVPNSTVIQVESDDVHDRQVWKIVLAAQNGRVVVSIDTVTGQVLDQQSGEANQPTSSSTTQPSDDQPGHDVGDDHGGDRVDDRGGDSGSGHGGTDDGSGHR